MFIKDLGIYINGLAQDCSISMADERTGDTAVLH